MNRTLSPLVLGSLVSMLIFGQGCGDEGMRAPAATPAGDTPVTLAGPAEARPQAPVAGDFAPTFTPPAAGPRAPAVGLPATGDLASLVAQIRERFGLGEITGPGIRRESLETLERVCALFPAGSLRGLGFVFESAPDGSTMMEAHWEAAFDANTGEPHPAGANPRVIFHVMTVKPAAAVHEIGHHLTGLVDMPWGVSLITSLGYRSTAGQAPPAFQVNVGQWSAAGVPGASFPTEYSKASAMEHAAELITFHLAPRSMQELGLLVPGFVMPESPRQVLASRL